MTEAPISVGFISLGCAKNLVDSQIMAGALVAAGIRLAPSPEEADVVIVNTCAFIADAREESLEHIRAACKLKHSTNCRAVLVAGCLPQRYHRDLVRQLPDVDGFIGLDQLDQTAAIVRRLMQGERALMQVSQESKALFEPPVPGLVFSAGRYAYLKIAEGCDHPCAFCAIPGIRGAHRSRPLDRIVAEAEHLLANGFRELDLISQDTTSYGRDLSDGVDLSQLLRRLGALGSGYWLRLLYGYPTGITAALLAAMAEVPQVCAYLDVPIQHSHPDMLRAMLRADTIPHVATMVQRARQALPRVTLRTTCLVGFPGETDAHFEHLLETLAQAEFDHVGAFVFSPEEGTPAMLLPDRPLREVAEERRDQLMELQRGIVGRKAAQQLGHGATVLLERSEAADDEIVWLARTERQAPEVDGIVYVMDVPPNARPGDFISVRFTEQAEYDMCAEATS